MVASSVNDKWQLPKSHVIWCAIRSMFVGVSGCHLSYHHFDLRLCLCIQMTAMYGPHINVTLMQQNTKNNKNTCCIRHQIFFCFVRSASWVELFLSRLYWKKHDSNWTQSNNNKKTDENCRPQCVLCAAVHQNIYAQTWNAAAYGISICSQRDASPSEITLFSTSSRVSFGIIFKLR